MKHLAVVFGMTVAGVSSAQTQVHSFGCERTRAGCPDTPVLPPANPVVVSGSFTDLLLAKLPNLTPNGGRNGFNKYVGAAISDGNDFTLVKCTYTSGRAFFKSCSFTEGSTSENMRVYTPVQFLQMLNQ